MSLKHIISLITITILGFTLSSCAKKESDKLFQMKAENKIIDTCIAGAENTQAMSMVMNKLDISDLCKCSSKQLFQENDIQVVRKAIETNDTNVLDPMMDKASKSCLKSLNMQEKMNENFGSKVHDMVVNGCIGDTKKMINISTEKLESICQCTADKFLADNDIKEVGQMMTDKNAAKIKTMMQNSMKTCVAKNGFAMQ